jgi:hypothetical protein
MKVNKLRLFCFKCGKSVPVKIIQSRSILDKVKNLFTNRKEFYCRRCGNFLKESL